MSLLLHEKTRIRNVRRNSKHFLTIKVDFLTNNVVLRTKLTMTVSRNVTNDFRAETWSDLLLLKSYTKYKKDRKRQKKRQSNVHVDCSVFSSVFFCLFVLRVPSAGDNQDCKWSLTLCNNIILKVWLSVSETKNWQAVISYVTVWVLWWHLFGTP